ncbi:MAG: M20/M25/M40 family metallo-hydrolase [Planctomycetes bacterium]|nr:M20/M25/M40 family metallo-hydrolase [Planctomycetota bacterium]
MNFNKNMFGFLPLLFAVSCASSQINSAPPKEKLARIVMIADSSSQVEPYIKHLCLDIGPRLTGSTQCNNAVKWAKEKFDSFGLKGTIEEWGTYPVGFDRGALTGKIISPIQKNIDVGTSSWAMGTDGPKHGPVRMMPANAEEYQKNPGIYKNAWIMRTTAGRAAGAVTELMNQMREGGALGFLRNTGSDLIHTGGNPGVEWDKWSKNVSINLKDSEYKEIAQMVKDEKEVALEFNISNKFVKGPISLNNVYADLVGSEKPDEYIIIGGHIDSWDGAQGATDNGTGVVTTLEAARLLTKGGFKPKRTIRFMLWSGEEEGLLGSQGWISKHQDMLPKISCVIVHDEGTNYLNGLQVTKSVRPLFEPALAPLMTLDPKMPFELKDVRSLPIGIGSDHDSFLMAGVPGFFWMQQKGDVEYERQHHTQYDKVDVVRNDYQKHSSIVIAYTALSVANLDQAVPRDGLIAGAGRKRLGIQPDGDMKLTAVTPGGMAEKAGIKVGDKIIKINKNKIGNLEDLREELAAPEKTAIITVLRDGKEIDIKVEWP